MSKIVQDIMDRARKDAIAYVSLHIMIGTDVIWTRGRYRGRVATVRDISVDYGDVNIWVSTRSKKSPSGYLVKHDFFHRCGHPPESFGVVVP